MPVGTLLTAAFLLQRPQGRNPFDPANGATVHDAPDRTCDLIHVDVELDVDYPARAFKGRVTNTLVPLRSGLTEILLHAGKDLTLASVRVDGAPVTPRREDESLFVPVPVTKAGRKIQVAIAFSASNSKGRSFGGGGGGFHWIEPRGSTDKDHVGFWTQGETEFNRQWCPTWDYPNDLTTVTETYTVPAEWTAIGNGKLVSEKRTGDRKTFVWRQDLPQATYLFTAVGGPFDIKKDAWRGVPLWYVVPRGQGRYIDASFGDTPDMLSFYSDTFGYRYPWAKYAQNAMYDFGGGMENVSATTLGAGSLTDGKDGFRTMASLNSHELGHQWFGDTVTCKDWGDTFLNESFATFAQMLYFEHSRGEDAYLWEVDSNQQSYLGEAQRVQRPVSTKIYTVGDDMFSSGTTYAKGGALLHALRRWLGDEAFFAGIKLYLNTYQHTPVNSAQLERAITDASGINVTPFFDQWFRKPGLPSLDFAWDYAEGKVTVRVGQTQATTDGTPTYRIPNARLGVIVDGKLSYVPAPLAGVDSTFSVAAPRRPDAVVFDPDHDFPRIVRLAKTPTTDEFLAILSGVKDPAQRSQAASALVTEGSAASIDAVLAALRADRGVSPAFVVPRFRRSNATYPPAVLLADSKRTELRGFWIEELGGKNAARRALAVRALAALPNDADTTKTLRTLVNDREDTPVVVAAIEALASGDKAAHRDLFERATKFEDRRGEIAAAAKKALAP